VETWRSPAYYIYRVLIYDLIPLPSEISILGYLQEDTEEYRGVYIMGDILSDVMGDIFDMMDPFR
jgi:hypothetical protein